MKKKKEKIHAVYFVFVSSKPKDEMSKLFSKAAPIKKVHGILKSPDATPERRSPGNINSHDNYCFPLKNIFSND